MTTTTALAINIPLMVLAFALMVGIPLWFVLTKRWHREADTTPVVPQAQRAYEHAYATRRRQAADARRPRAASVWEA
jgi:hypothetical protein